MSLAESYSKRSDMPAQIDPMLFPITVESMTASEIRFRAHEFERSPAMERMRQDMQMRIDQVTMRMCLTPIQFRFPKSKRRRIQKKWRKDTKNFRRLLGPDLLDDIQIVGWK